MARTMEFYKKTDNYPKVILIARHRIKLSLLEEAFMEYHTSQTQQSMLKVNNADYKLVCTYQVLLETPPPLLDIDQATPIIRARIAKMQ